ncbi:MAG TPA: hypothetical protein VGR00_10855 [Thermoanaerobaculia bacterium]|nr:hypothetical protein [Thermoanaerobaculia bacterium]
MVLYALWVVPGLRGPGADETARRLWDGADEERPGDPKPLPRARIEETAALLKRTYPDLVDDPSAFEAGEAGLGLEWKAERSRLGVDVDEKGVVVSLFGHGTPPENEADLERGLRISRTSADHLEGAVFDPQLSRMVDGDRDKEAILVAARQAWASTYPSAANKGVLMWLPLVGFVVAAVFLRRLGPIAFVAVPVVFALAVFLAKRLGARAGSPSPSAPVPSSDNRPINP